MSKKLILLLFGPPGSGKTTAFSVVSKDMPSIKYISAGELSRRELVV